VHVTSGSGNSKVTLLPVEDQAPEPDAPEDPVARQNVLGESTGQPSHSEATSGPATAGSTGVSGSSPKETGPASVDTTALPVINQQR
jgi:hypothetical protein